MHKSFDQRVDELRAYSEKLGHVNIKGSQDKSLYGFCSNMRQARNNPGKSNNMTLTDERIASLDALGFDWAVNDQRVGEKRKSFKQRVEDLREYKGKHGHINVKKSEDKSLYDFCKGIRYARNNPCKSTTVINEDRIASLDALGFDWLVKEHAAKKSFAQRIDDLQAYKEKHGHIRVKQSDDKSLYEFCRNIRRARNNPEKSNSAINEECIASLDALGFDWTERKKARVSFEQQIEHLRAYKEKHGHVNVKKSDDMSLSKFCTSIRYARNNPGKSTVLINENRIASLDALGFDWAAKKGPTEKHGGNDFVGVFEVPKEDYVSYNC